jgi:hypothetical protein
MKLKYKINFLYNWKVELKNNNLVKKQENLKRMRIKIDIKIKIML